MTNKYFPLSPSQGLHLGSSGVSQFASAEGFAPYQQKYTSFSRFEKGETTLS